MPATIAAFLAQPFSPNMSAVRWFLFVGLLIVMLWGWHQVLRDVSRVEAAVAS